MYKIGMVVGTNGASLGSSAVFQMEDIWVDTGSSTGVFIERIKITRR